MREIISAVVLIVTLFAGTQFLKVIHDSIRDAALEKSSKGLSSLSEMTRSLQKKKEARREIEK